jgi:hypothetical protein
MALNFDWLRADVKAAATVAIEELRAAHPGEQFYTFALCTDDGVAGISPAANTEEHLAKRTAEYNYRKSAEINYLRWSTGEWAYEGFGWNHFKPSYDAMMAVRHPPEGDDDPFPVYRRRVLQLMIDVLADLDADGVFGRGADRERVTLLCSVSDTDNPLALLDRSARALNPPPVVARYDATRMGQ